MPTQFYLFLAAVILLMTLGRIVVVRRRGSKGVDWALVAAFIRLEFPPDQRDIAQRLAAGLAEIVGMKIKRLKPEDRLEQIAGWAENQIRAADLIKVLQIAYRIRCDGETTFRALVEMVADGRALDGAAPTPPRANRN